MLRFTFAFPEEPGLKKKLHEEDPEARSDPDMERSGS
jgi:hypothetical protein